VRKMTLEELESKISAKSHAVDVSVHAFRAKSKELGWIQRRTRPRHKDEIKSLNYLARTSLRAAMKNGSVRYDKERRVLVFAELEQG
jgi:hypothetical protein